MNLAEQLDDATSAQPYADRPAAHYVAAGQRARRRRRASLVAGAAVVLLAVGGVAAGLQATQPDPRPVGAATQGPNPTDPAPTAQVYRDLVASGARAGYDNRTGDLALAPGWEITQRIESPWRTGPFGEPTPPTKSVALVMTDGTEVQWLLLDWEAGAQESGAIYDDDPGARGFTSLAAYADVEMARRQVRSTDELVAFDGAGTLAPRNGITVLDQVPHELTDGTPAVLARLRVLGQDWYVVARRTADGASYLPLAYPVEGDDPGLAGFGAHVHDLMARGRLG